MEVTEVKDIDIITDTEEKLNDMQLLWLYLKETDDYVTPTVLKAYELSTCTGLETPDFHKPLDFCEIDDILSALRNARVTYFTLSFRSDQLLYYLNEFVEKDCLLVHAKEISVLEMSPQPHPEIVPAVMLRV